jgi:ergothioneine biosynthesis protein EgtB
MIETFRQRLRETWAMSDRIFDLLPRESWLEQPIRLRHPVLFYIGHLPAFAWNQVGRAVLGLGQLHPEFDELFERGIDPVGVDGYEAATQWPPLDDVLEYRDRVREHLLALVERVLERADRDPLAARGRILNVVLEHELMHQETLQYMLQQLEPEAKRRPESLAPYRFERGAANGSVEVGGGEVVLGADFESVEFGWDNEFPEHRLEVRDFQIDRTPVTIGDWIGFMEDAGYRRPELWQAGDWQWRSRNAVEHPADWKAANGGWQLRTMFDRLNLDRVRNWPVMVSLAEARAYCRWRGRRLPTEAELHRALYTAPSGEQRRYPWGDAPPEPGVHGNFGFSRWAPAAVGSFPEGASGWGVHDGVGNLWQWTASPFAPLPGFTPYIRSYPGYSADFFDERHFVMLGASWATPTAIIRRSLRNWFQDRYQYAFAGFRTVAPH